MKLYRNERLTIFFGDARTAVHPDMVRGKYVEEVFLSNQAFAKIKETIPSLTTLVVAHQVHGTQGIMVTDENAKIPLFTRESDYVVTALPGVGLGVATADCMPVILYDCVQRVAAAVHAGWRGLVSGVVENALDTLKANYGTKIADVICLVGPSARACCYEVGKDFAAQATAMNRDSEKALEFAINRRGGREFFDNERFLRYSMLHYGLPDGNMDFSWSACTICNKLYCSYRREKMSPLRQLTIVSLK